jgi:hypothetical protein
MKMRMILDRMPQLLLAESHASAPARPPAAEIENRPGLFSNKEHAPDT